MSANASFVRVTLLAFLLNALLPFFAVYDTARAASLHDAPLPGGKLLICTGDGFKWVSQADLHKTGKHLPASHYKCPLCYLAAHGLTHAAPPLAAVPVFIRPPAQAPPIVHDDSVIAFSFLSPLGSRAPPSFAG